ncbi:UDP-N-acetylmuramoyl-L-alanyl-D-glutamate--2,6-diaminopimelate ligase [Psychromonas sp. 14N.309.X.WAT.B.A12]|uniref:UDP-N-acetylmuramoyl-L-alanyl-D-glutamate--2, 6-diaminopimelate ligase n=1 Tax=Psychromonas sp. 14N.309.X.WAT.B.A12 TaxID=2998322 RepID=UPI0025B11A04|nr:UDP-N-acetylmuramoyl-L-alanyl-D-glutamate--2,6-diaminopimelate ligase [Psychromonas sp. 14N.309.X.WAT.B.A12]MDN2663671.1 UDP-N-acetylmuramoyl-L-alanyl-D-glutamate--2,6-diaminopimelate ligase [Psychromonas sp. 14N.309.X.WAT.B.A12]
MASDTQQSHPSCVLSWLLATSLPTPDDSLSSLSTIISGMTLDSREVKQGDLFVALQGAVNDGRQFINNAIQSGAVAVLSETLVQDENGYLSYQGGVPVIQLFQLQRKISAIAMRYYFPQSNLHKVTAVTGTNGKTTIASLLANSYTLLGQQSAQMGTIGNGLYNQLQASLNTTLDAISVCRELASYQTQGATRTIMEVSSHGLVQGRIAAVPFNTAIFTNLTRDHLDYHGTMQAYADAKQTLFEKFPLQHRIINANDQVGRNWLMLYPEAIAYGLNIDFNFTERQYFNVTKVDYLAQGLAFEFMSSWGSGVINTPFYGDFNVLNIAAVSCALLADGFSLAAIQQVMAKLTVVPGRMEQYFFPKQQVTFVVDYAHTPDALDNALQALQHHKQQGRIIAVFGCGGDRDKGKRPQMANVAEQVADLVMIVDDNPRSEDAKLIVEDIKAGLTAPEKALVIHDRQQAIQYLLANSNPDDIVLLAGKGHEDYQIFGDKKVHYSDRECLQTLLNEEAIQDNDND